MSIRVIDLIWKCDIPFEPSVLLVLLALADWANDDGYCWPAIPSLARKSRQSERSVQRIVRKLQAEGYLLIEEGGGRHRSNGYQLTLSRFHPFHERVTPAPKKGDTQRGNGDTRAGNGDIAVSPEPSVPEPSTEPSLNRGAPFQKQTPQGDLAAFEQARDRFEEVFRLHLKDESAAAFLVLWNEFPDSDAHSRAREYVAAIRVHRQTAWDAYRRAVRRVAIAGKGDHAPPG